MAARSSLKSHFQVLSPSPIRRIPNINNKYSQNLLSITENQRIQRLKFLRKDQELRPTNRKLKNSRLKNKLQ